LIPAKAVAGPTSDGRYAWTVQLAAFRTPARTEKGWKILSKVAPEVLMPLEHWVRNPNPDFKWDRLFRLRTYAFEDRRPAEEICARIRARNLECLVVRTQRVPGLQFASQSRVAQADPKVDTTTRTAKAAQVPTEGATKTVSRRTETPSRGTAKQPGAADDVMKTAVDRQRSGAARTAKSHSPHPAYQVQLAVYKSESRAEKGWRELTQAAPDVLGKLGHAVQRTQARDSGTALYRLRTLAYADQAPARDICQKLRRRSIQCIVVSTPDHAGLVYEPSEFEKANAPPPPPRQPRASAKRQSPQRHADAGWPKDFDAY
jgi:hypothetical protein